MGRDQRLCPGTSRQVPGAMAGVMLPASGEPPFRRGDLGSGSGSSARTDPADLRVVAFVKGPGGAGVWSGAGT